MLYKFYLCFLLILVCSIVVRSEVANIFGSSYDLKAGLSLTDEDSKFGTYSIKTVQDGYIQLANPLEFNKIYTIEAWIKLTDLDTAASSLNPYFTIQTNNGSASKDGFGIFTRNSLRVTRDNSSGSGGWSTSNYDFTLPNADWNHFVMTFKLDELGFVVGSNGKRLRSHTTWSYRYPETFVFDQISFTSLWGGYSGGSLIDDLTITEGDKYGIFNNIWSVQTYTLPTSPVSLLADDAATWTIDPCLSNDCQNGSCVPNGESFTCSCDSGYEGAQCQTDINDCNHDDCQNGSTCVDLVNGYECSCADGFEGTHCENPIMSDEDIPYTLINLSQTGDDFKYGTSSIKTNNKGYVQLAEPLKKDRYYTIEAWAKLDGSIQQYQNILTVASSNTNIHPCEIRLKQDGGMYMINNNSGSSAGGKSVLFSEQAFGEWRHFVIVFHPLYKSNTSGFNGVRNTNFFNHETSPSWHWNSECVFDQIKFYNSNNNGETGSVVDDLTITEGDKYDLTIGYKQEYVLPTVPQSSFVDAGPVSICDLVNCQNDGTCVEDNEKGAVCNCAFGYFGQYCEEEVVNINYSLVNAHTTSSDTKFGSLSIASNEFDKYWTDTYGYIKFDTPLDYDKTYTIESWIKIPSGTHNYAPIFDLQNEPKVGEPGYASIRVENDRFRIRAFYDSASHVNNVYQMYNFKDEWYHYMMTVSFRPLNIAFGFNGQTRARLKNVNVNFPNLPPMDRIAFVSRNHESNIGALYNDLIITEGDKYNQLDTSAHDYDYRYGNPTSALSNFDGSAYEVDHTDPCNEHLCENGSQCVANGEDYTCDCDGLEFHGDKCERPNDLCLIPEENQCKNGSTCKYRENLGRVACLCINNYFGRWCQKT